MKALQPVDYNTGFDLSTEADQATVTKMIDRYRPLILIQGIDCRDWTILQDNVNYIRRQVLLNMRRAKARNVLKKVVQWSREQSRQGRFRLLEDPLTSRIWLEADIQVLRELPDTQEGVCHAGAYGAVNSRGQPI